MPELQKIIYLLSRKYNTNVSILGHFPISKFTSILDIDNGTLFIVSDESLFYFKDKNKNLWLTIVESFHLNGEIQYPKLGDSYMLSGGFHYSFTTKEEIVEMAIKYFEKHQQNLV
ncbi:hypothetical protein [Flavobacterium ustbae]|uniref:hypothetical protein n=1 Tax=Flavobacterium ustbae TaxID=2488790 RepID=UPI000F7A8317|nr:hypothetical protein [Flavobacterium ustbae]